MFGKPIVQNSIGRGAGLVCASYVRTPDPDWFGFDVFTDKANDGELESGEATVTVDFDQARSASDTGRYVWLM